MKHEGILRAGDDRQWAYYSDEGSPESAALMPEHGGAQYRYALGWRWDLARRVLVWMMLNPSTATHLELDPTLRACVEFTRRWGYGGMIVLNAYGWRATDPKLLPRIDGRPSTRAIGPQNDIVIGSIIGAGHDVVVGWGKHCAMARARDVHRMLRAAQRRGGPPFRIDCIGTNGDGSPRHPLYIARTTERRPWSPP